MALKNDPSISEFGKRLYELIEETDSQIDNEEDQIKSPKGLARKLYESGLVHVNTGDNDNSPERDRENAVGSIEKTIVRHIKTGIIKDQKGEFVIAYSKFFHCSADYILGMTNIRTPDISIKAICELTDLSENVVLRLIESKKENHREQTACWSFLMNSDLYYTVPMDWVTLAEEARVSMQKEGELKALQWELTKVNGPEKMDIQLDIEGVKQEMDSRRAAFYGILSKVSRNIADYIENDITAKLQSFRSRFATEIMKQTKGKYNQ